MWNLGCSDPPYPNAAGKMLPASTEATASTASGHATCLNARSVILTDTLHAMMQPATPSTLLTPPLELIV